MSKQAKQNISKAKIGTIPWNKELNHKLDNRIKIKSVENIKAKKYGMRQQDWIDFSKNFRSKFDECYECHKPISLVSSDIDHKIPYKINHNNSIENLVVLCKSCHAKKTYHKDNIALWEVNH